MRSRIDGGFRCPQGRAKAQEFGLFARDWVFRLEVFSSCRLMSLTTELSNLRSRRLMHMCQAIRIS